jgi:endonuclease/exonuclease/phosphatase family metal-dependent hydrolase
LRVRVLTLNVENLEGDPRRQEIIRAELQRLDPDLLSLQEVVQDDKHDQFADLLRGTNLRGLHQAEVIRYTPPYASRYGGAAVASRWPMRLVEALDLRTANCEISPWMTLAAVVEIPGEAEMLFIGTTPCAGLDGAAARERHVVMLTDLDQRHRRELPTVIAGDFTTNPDSSSIRYLRGLQSLSGQSVQYHDAWIVAGDGPGYTWDCDNPLAQRVHDAIIGQPNFRERIDYVFVGATAPYQGHPNAYARILSAEVVFNSPVDGMWPSDHFGLLVELEVGLRASADAP